jgi:hypothetical protein
MNGHASATSSTSSASGTAATNTTAVPHGSGVAMVSASSSASSSSSSSVSTSRHQPRVNPLSIHATQHSPFWRWELWSDLDELLDFEPISFPTVGDASSTSKSLETIPSVDLNRTKTRVRTGTATVPLSARGTSTKPTKSGGIMDAMKRSMKKKRELDVSRKFTITSEDEFKERASMIELLSDDEEIGAKRKRKNEELLEQVQRTPELQRAVDVFKKHPSEVCCELDS